MVTMAQSATTWCRNTHTHVDRTHSLTHLHQHSYDHVVRSVSSAITEVGIYFLFRMCLREGEKSADSQPANRYDIYIRRAKPTSRAGIEP